MEVIALVVESDPDILQVSAAVGFLLQNHFTLWLEVWVGEEVGALFLQV